jgi:hypothetical protein
MKIEPFTLERRQPVREHRAAWNLTEGSVQPPGLDECAEQWDVR